jgi:hypothetical protein
MSQANTFRKQGESIPISLLRFSRGGGGGFGVKPVVWFFEWYLHIIEVCKTNKIFNFLELATSLYQYLKKLATKRYQRATGSNLGVSPGSCIG